MAFPAGHAGHDGKSAGAGSRQACGPSPPVQTLGQWSNPSPAQVLKVEILLNHVRPRRSTAQQATSGRRWLAGYGLQHTPHITFHTLF